MLLALQSECDRQTLEPTTMTCKYKYKYVTFFQVHIIKEPLTFPQNQVFLQLLSSIKTTQISKPMFFVPFGLATTENQWLL